MKVKICTYNNHDVDVENFRKSARYKDGRVNWCKECEKSYHAKRYVRAKSVILANSKKYYEDNRKSVLERHALWRAGKKEDIKEYHKNYANLYPHKNRERCRRYQAAKLKAVPLWLSRKQMDELKDIYFKCPEGYEVDHIIPLQGENVCGLHVPWNLQYLTISDNRRKKNKY